MTHILSRAALAASITTGAMADENGFTTEALKDNVQRTQLHPLPNVVLDSMFKTTAETYRNPSGRKKSQVGYHSLGFVDERSAVSYSNSKYDAVVQMLDHNGDDFCTASVSTIKGFEPDKRGTIFSFAAHCLDITDPDGNVIGQMNPKGIIFVGSYLNENNVLSTYKMYGSEVWIDPLYRENEKVDIKLARPKKYNADTALVFAKHVVPNKVRPAEVITFNFQSAIQFSDSLQKLVKKGSKVTIDATGHSADKPYLTTHQSAEIVSSVHDRIVTKADAAPGASGGAMHNLRINGLPTLGADTDKITILGINSTAVSTSGYTEHAYFNEFSLKSAPFLKVAGSDSNKVCYTHAEITASKLNLRIGPGTNFEKIVGSSNNTKGYGVMVFGQAKNKLGEVWALVQTTDDRTGYVSANPEYLNMYPEFCFKI